MVTKQLVALTALRKDVFVRQRTNDERVLQLAELLESGVELDPITVTPDFMVIDGRHRIEAHDILNRKEIAVEIKTPNGRVELIAMAYKANTGGSLPPTPADTEHTILMLLDLGETKKAIGELLGLPPSLAKKYVNTVQSRDHRAKLQRAGAAVTDGGLTVAKAAEQFNVDLSELKGVLSGHRKKHSGVGEIKLKISSEHRSFGKRRGTIISSILDKYQDGDLTKAQVEEFFQHMDDALKESQRTLEERKRRFHAITIAKGA